MLPAGFAVPAVAEHDADGIGALLELRGHVVGHVEDALRVVTGRRVEHVVADAPAVEIELVPAQAGDVETGVSDRLIEFKRSAQEGGSDIGMRADPLPGPVALVEQPHREGGRLAVVARPPVLVPDPHLPPAALFAGEVGAAVRHVYRAIGRYLAAVPPVAALREQALPAAGDQDLIGRLGLAASVGFEQPAEAGSSCVDVDRIGRVLTGQVGWGDHIVWSLYSENEGLAVFSV